MNGNQRISPALECHIPAVSMLTRWGKPITGEDSTKKKYLSFVCGDEEYFLYDCVYLQNRNVYDPPYIGKIEELWEDVETEEKLATIRWFFRPSELEDADLAEFEEHEVFLAVGEGLGVKNVNPLDSILARARILCTAPHPENILPSKDDICQAHNIFRRVYNVDSTELQPIEAALEEMPAAAVFNKKEWLSVVNGSQRATDSAVSDPTLAIFLGSGSAAAQENETTEVNQSIEMDVNLSSETKVPLGGTEREPGSEAELQNKKTIAAQDEGKPNSIETLRPVEGRGETAEAGNAFIVDMDISEDESNKATVPPSSDTPPAKPETTSAAMQPASQRQERRERRNVSEAGGSRVGAVGREREKGGSRIEWGLKRKTEAQQLPQVTKSPLPLVQQESDLNSGMAAVEKFKSAAERKKTWEATITTAVQEERVLLLQNLDKLITNEELHDILTDLFPERFVDCQIIPSFLSIEANLGGEGLVMFKTRSYARDALDLFLQSVVVLGVEERPLVVQLQRVKQPLDLSVIGHMDLDRLSANRALFRSHHILQHKKRSTPSHCCQPNTMEYEFALDWRVLEEEHKAQMLELQKVQEAEFRSFTWISKPKDGHKSSHPRVSKRGR